MSAQAQLNANTNELYKEYKEHHGVDQLIERRKEIEKKYREIFTKQRNNVNNLEKLNTDVPEILDEINEMWEEERVARGLAAGAPIDPRFRLDKFIEEVEKRNLDLEVVNDDPNMLGKTSIMDYPIGTLEDLVGQFFNTMMIRPRVRVMGRRALGILWQMDLTPTILGNIEIMHVGGRGGAGLDGGIGAGPDPEHLGIDPRITFDIDAKLNQKNIVNIKDITGYAVDAAAAIQTYTQGELEAKYSGDRFSTADPFAMGMRRVPFILRYDTDENRKMSSNGTYPGILENDEDVCVYYTNTGRLLSDIILSDPTNVRVDLMDNRLTLIDGRGDIQDRAWDYHNRRKAQILANGVPLGVPANEATYIGADQHDFPLNWDAYMAKIENILLLDTTLLLRNGRNPGDAALDAAARGRTEPNPQYVQGITRKVMTNSVARTMYNAYMLGYYVVENTYDTYELRSTLQNEMIDIAFPNDADAALRAAFRKHPDAFYDYLMFAPGAQLNKKEGRMQGIFTHSYYDENGPIEEYGKFGNTLPPDEMYETIFRKTLNEVVYQNGANISDKFSQILVGRFTGQFRDAMIRIKRFMFINHIPSEYEVPSMSKLFHPDFGDEFKGKVPICGTTMFRNAFRTMVNQAIAARTGGGAAPNDYQAIAQANGGDFNDIALDIRTFLDMDEPTSGYNFREELRQYLSSPDDDFEDSPGRVKTYSVVNGLLNLGTIDAAADADAAANEHIAQITAAVQDLTTDAKTRLEELDQVYANSLQLLTTLDTKYREHLDQLKQAEKDRVDDYIRDFVEAMRRHRDEARKNEEVRTLDAHFDDILAMASRAFDAIKIQGERIKNMYNAIQTKLQNASVSAEDKKKMFEQLRAFRVDYKKVYEMRAVQISALVYMMTRLLEESEIPENVIIKTLILNIYKAYLTKINNAMPEAKKIDLDKYLREKEANVAVGERQYNFATQITHYRSNLAGQIPEFNRRGTAAWVPIRSGGTYYLLDLFTGDVVYLPTKYKLPTTSVMGGANVVAPETMNGVIVFSIYTDAHVKDPNYWVYYDVGRSNLTEWLDKGSEKALTDMIFDILDEKSVKKFDDTMRNILLMYAFRIPFKDNKKESITALEANDRYSDLSQDFTTYCPEDYQSCYQRFGLVSMQHVRRLILRSLANVLHIPADKVDDVLKQRTYLKDHPFNGFF